MLEFIFSALFSAAPVKQPEKPAVIPHRVVTVWRIEEIPFVDELSQEDE
jgi:hypothetical protein